MPTAKSDGAVIAYDVRGEGVPVVLLHGIFASRAEWQPQIDSLSRWHQVVACDFRGHGESTRSDEPYTMEQFAGDVVSVLDHLGLDRAVLCGHSFGGLVAQELALTYPDRVLGLILSETLYGITSTPWEMAVAASLKLMVDLSDPETFAGLFATYFGLFSPDGPERIKREVEPHIADKPNARNIFKASLAFDSRWRLQDIACPTLLVVGQIPHIPLIQLQALEMIWRIGNSRLEVIPRAGHMVHWDNPAAFERAVTSFVNGLLA